MTSWPSSTRNLHEVRPDESRGARDENAHDPPSPGNRDDNTQAAGRAFAVILDSYISARPVPSFDASRVEIIPRPAQR